MHKFMSKHMSVYKLNFILRKTNQHAKHFRTVLMVIDNTVRSLFVFNLNNSEQIIIPRFATINA